MATISISTRKTASGKRYDVRYRLGGRTYPVIRAGTFKTEREAKQRRDLVAGEIAHGRNPALLIATLSQARDVFEPFETWAERYVASRIDLAPNTRKMHGSHLRKFGETFSDRDPLGIEAPDIAAWIATQSNERKAGTVAQYLDCLKVFFDFVGAEPNPARDPRVKLPRRDTEEANAPSDEHYRAILDKLVAHWRLFFITIEQGALRPGEALGLKREMSTSPACDCVSPAPKPRHEPRDGCRSPSGSWTLSRRPVRSRTASRSARSSRDVTTQRRDRR